MTLEMVQGDYYVGIGNGCANHCLACIVEVDLYLAIVSTLDTVADDNMAAGAEWVVSVGEGSFEMIRCVGSARRGTGCYSQ